MKRQTLLVVIALVLMVIPISTAFSQETPTFSSSGFDSTDRDIFSTLDHRNISSGILYDKQMVRFTNLDKFGYLETLFDTTNVSNLEISDTVELNNWKQAYFEMHNSHLSTPTIPNIQYLDSLAKAYKKIS